MYDLIVIGGGPAGAAAAIGSARSGARVLLLERGRFPRHKVCGEFVSAESLELLAELLGQQQARLLQKAVVIPRARAFVDDYALPAPVEPAAASIARWDLDEALWDSAQQCGVEAKQQVTAERITGRGPFLVTTSAGDFEARALVNASGRWSNLRAGSSGNGHEQGKWIGLKAHFVQAPGPASVDLYFFDGGYCGVQPVETLSDPGRSRVNACAMVRADVARTLPEVLALHPALRERAAGWEPLTDPVSVAPLVFKQPEPSRDSILLIGDAAGFVDPFVGDGISLALRSGSAAAQCLAGLFAGNISLEFAIRQYAEEYEQRLAPVFRASARIRRMLAMPRMVRKPVVSFLQHAPAITRYVVRKTR
jgi:flavin-dependent dehydrogenase